MSLPQIRALPVFAYCLQMKAGSFRGLQGTLVSLPQIRALPVFAFYLSRRELGEQGKL